MVARICLRLLERKQSACRIDGWQVKQLVTSARRCYSCLHRLPNSMPAVPQWSCAALQRTRLGSGMFYPHSEDRIHRMWHSSWTSAEDEENLEGGESTSMFGEKVEELLKDSEYHLYLREYCSIPNVGHRLFVIQPDFKSGPDRNTLTTGQLKLEEAVALVTTLPRWEVVEKEVVNIRKPNSKLMFSDNQFREITMRIRDFRSISAVFVSRDLLSASQLATYQAAWGVPVFDRYTLVLQIFKEHARTKEAKLQVALAEVPYIRSRLGQIQSGHGDRQTGEARFAGGTGRAYIQLRSKLLQEREARLRSALNILKKRREVLRKNRLKRKLPIVAVVGYTNSGKTTLIKALTADQQMTPQDKLFATLDVTAHAGLLPNYMKAIFMDTVGFISDIPVSLINAFSATLEDALLADVVLHVRDISHPASEDQKQTVLQTLRGMLSPQQMEGIIEVRNKVDKQPQVPDDSEGFSISATGGQGLGDLHLAIQRSLLVRMGYMEKKLRIPMSGPHLSWLYQEATVVSSAPDNSSENLVVEVVINQASYAKFKSYFGRQSDSR